MEMLLWNMADFLTRHINSKIADDLMTAWYKKQVNTAIVIANFVLNAVDSLSKMMDV